MATIPRPKGARQDRSVRDLGSDVVKLVVAYARQETVDPLKLLARYVLWGVVGAVLLGIGSVLVAVAVVRALQSEFSHHLTGSLTWIPYLGGLVVVAAVAGLAVSRITKKALR